ncbi:hypothetical protein BJ508DRAFT_174558 [Ascobolus immersus RN42]|uniref:Uncharacterized protein n=1 Tax=Ascobolus immersus RN42 TaxID=1160509 RepID=A0A3N4HUX2_ASCIM|nr:hypothetical protein BJ508DRAFT_174558 [Ascobolus immersus RN42]
MPPGLFERPLPKPPTKEEVMQWDQTQVIDLVRNTIAYPLDEEDESRFESLLLDGETLLRVPYWNSDFWTVRKMSPRAAQYLNGVVQDLFDLWDTDDEEVDQMDPTLDGFAAWDRIRYMKWLADTEGWNLEAFSDPRQSFRLLFPHNCYQQLDFPLSEDGMFSFVGRPEIKLLYQKLINESRAPVTVYCYGTEGFGRSHILAALVILLILAGERVVYIPNCHRFLMSEPMELGAALLTTFHDSIARQEEIMRFRSTWHVMDFFERLDEKLIFVVDSCEALRRCDLSPGECAIEVYEEKCFTLSSDYTLSTSNLLARISRGSGRLLCSASASITWRKERSYRQHQMAREWVELNGGFDEVAMKTWWDLQTVTVDDGERRRIEFSNGRVPLLMMNEVESVSSGNDYNTGELYGYSKALRFAEVFKRLFMESPWKVKEYFALLKACLFGNPCANPDVNVLDHRYYFHDGATVRAITPWLRIAAQEAIHKSQPTVLKSSDYIFRIPDVEGNQWMIEQFAKGAMVASIRQMGIVTSDLNLPGPIGQHSLWELDSASFKVEDLVRRMYVPSYELQWPSFDLLVLNPKKRECSEELLVGVFPLKFTLDVDTASFQGTENMFFSNWDNIFNKIRFDGDQRRNASVDEVVYVWITPHGGPTTVFEKDQLWKCAANSDCWRTHPRYTRRIISLEDVNKELYEALLKAKAFPPRREPKPLTSLTHITRSPQPPSSKKSRKHSDKESSQAQTKKQKKAKSSEKATGAATTPRRPARSTRK